MDSNIVFSPINLNELINLIGSKVKDEIEKSKPVPQPVSRIETPIGFERAMEILCMKERTLRAKIASNEIPYYQRARQLYFFESEFRKLFAHMHH